MANDNGAPTSWLELVRAFVNTLDVDESTDVLDDPAAFASWLGEHGFPTRSPVAADDIELARALRSAIRDELTAHHDGGTDHTARRRIADLAQTLPLAVDTCTDGTPGLVPVGNPTEARALLSDVLAGMAIAGFDSTWHRLKICLADDCQWAYFDHSKNRSKRWCSMEVCGNRAKLRAYRERQAST